MQAIADVLPVDAVALDIHGAGVSETTEDIETDIGLAVRALVGPDVPIVSSLDLHGNIYDEMLRAYDANIVCRLYPHEDMRETGYKAFGLLPGLISGELVLKRHLERLPMTLPTTTTDPGFPHHRVNQLCHKLEAEYEDLVDVRVFHGFPWADIGLPSPTVLCHTKVSDGEVGAAAEAVAQSLAKQIAQQVANMIWEIREEFLPPTPQPPEVCAQALALAMKPGRGGPVVIHETSDNCGCGGPGDGTHLLRAMLAADLGRILGPRCVCFGHLCDGDAVQQALVAGVGSTCTITLGGRNRGEPYHGDPLVLEEARVFCVTDGSITLEKPSIAPGWHFELGPTVGLRVNDIDVLVTTGRNQTFDPVIFRTHGIDVTRYRIIALKSSIHFRAGFRELPNGYKPTIMVTDPPGLSSNRLETFQRTKSKQMLWPYAKDVVYESASVYATADARL